MTWIYRISASDHSLLYELLHKLTTTAITDDRTLLDALVETFKDAWAIRHWLKEENFRLNGSLTLGHKLKSFWQSY